MSKYYCWLCQHVHRFHSKIGKEHAIYVRNERAEEKRRTMSKTRRWRLWTCIQVNPDSAMKMRRARNKMRREIEALRKEGFKAKRWVTRPEHLTSGHFHIVVLSTLEEKCKLVGIEVRQHD